MRLSTEAGRDEGHGVSVVHAALEAGVRLFDTADAYCLDDAEIGHNERLLRRALETWPGDRAGVVVATKGGLRRPGGRWEPDGRAAHLAAACERSRRALGVEGIALYQLHAPDPRTPLGTSVRALRALQRDGRIAEIGLCNVSLRQLVEAQRIAEIAAVQLELSPFEERGFRSGVPEHCAANGVRLLAHRPLGGAESRARLERDPLLLELAERHAVTPQEVVLAWLIDLSPCIVPIPGPTTAEHARSPPRALAVRLDDDDRRRLDARFPAGRLLRRPRRERRPRDGAAPPGAEVVLVMGLPGAGKSTHAEELVAQGYARLNRDEAGGRLADLVPRLDRMLASGQRRVVLDNTYTSRAARNAVIEAAWEHGVEARCVWLRTSLADARRNVVQRMLARHGRLLGPDELRAAARRDPGALSPGAVSRHVRDLDPPTLDEGFSRVDEVAFARNPDPARAGKAVIAWYDGVLRASRSGRRRPLGPDDVVALPGRGEVLRRWQAEGYLLLGLAWHPEVAAGAMTESDVAACFARTHELLGVVLHALHCPHADGPVACWCRKPLPGLGVALVEQHALDPARCLYVGGSAPDRAFARDLGLEYRDQAEFFAGSGLAGR